eukprot:COSAG06_NODE_4869_length_3890_cov_346.413084_2_plen_105_part_00
MIAEVSAVFTLPNIGRSRYALDESAAPSAWKYVGTRQNLQSGTAQSGIVATNLPTDRMTSYRLYLPTYNTVIDGAIGMRKHCIFEPFLYRCEFDHLTKTGSGQT